MATPRHDRNVGLFFFSLLLCRASTVYSILDQVFKCDYHFFGKFCILSHTVSLLTFNCLLFPSRGVCHRVTWRKTRLLRSKVSRKSACCAFCLMKMAVSLFHFYICFFILQIELIAWTRWNRIAVSKILNTLTSKLQSF